MFYVHSSKRKENGWKRSRKEKREITILENTFASLKKMFIGEILLMIFGIEIHNKVFKNNHLKSKVFRL